jgi:MFS family permease
MSEALRDRDYRRLLLALLIPAAFFTGFDGELRAILLPQLRHTFHVSLADVGLANIPIAGGEFIALLIVRRADRIGRRPLLLVTLFGAALFTGLTAISPNLASFALFQTLCQICIGTEYALAVLVVAEEVPPEARGRTIGVLLIATPLGAVATAALLGAGLLHTSLGWRSFYLVGTVPMLIVAFGRRGLRETIAYEAVDGPPAHPIRDVLTPPWRGRILALGAVSFFEKIPATAGAGWWVYYAEHDRHLSTGIVSLDLGTAFLLGTSGYYCCGRAIDRFGRKPVTVVYLLCGCAAGIALFQAKGEIANFVLLLAAVFFGLGIAPALSALGIESFPTEIRAGASSIVGNGFGATGEVLGPALVGILGTTGGLIGTVGGTVSVLALLALVAVPILVLFVPETLGHSLVDSAAPGRENDQTSTPRLTGPPGA